MLQQEVATSRSVIGVLHVCCTCGTCVVYTTRIPLINTHVPSVLQRVAACCSVLQCVAGGNYVEICGRCVIIVIYMWYTCITCVSWHAYEEAVIFA